MNKEIFPTGMLIETPLLDIEAIQPHTEKWDVEFIKIGKDDLKVAIHAFHTPRIQFSAAYYTDAYLLKGRFPQGSIVLSYIHTKSTANFNNRKLRPDQLIAVTDADELNLITNGPSTNYSVAIEEAFFTSAFKSYFGFDFDTVESKMMLMLDASKTDAYVEILNDWLHFFLNTKDLVFSEEEYLQIEYEILDSLFGFVSMGKKRGIKRSDVKIGKARELLHRNLENTYYISDLVRELRVNERSLQYLFKEHLGISPKHYLKQLRLNAIRQELLSLKDVDVNIKEIARRYNFFHMGHFAAEYKKVFSETPSQTLKQYVSSS